MAATRIHSPPFTTAYNWDWHKKMALLTNKQFFFLAAVAGVGLYLAKSKAGQLLDTVQDTTSQAVNDLLRGESERDALGYMHFRRFEGWMQGRYDEASPWHNIKRIEQ